MLRVRVCTKRHVGGILMEMGGDEGKNKGAEVNKKKFNNQQGLKAAMEDSGTATVAH